MSGNGAFLFGPAHDGESVRFRLFSPTVDDIALELEDGPRISMRATEHGFREASARAAPGTHYRFLVRGTPVPDPASRLQSSGVHGWSVLTDAVPGSARTRWPGREWSESVICEIHPGLAGGFAGISEQLDQLKALGITAIELMPIAAFPGTRNWGYDGVLPFAPAEAYGTPAELRSLIDRAHTLGLMVYLDVVYNHFGPDGNYIALYAPEFFRDDIATPWGSAIDFRRWQVRRFFVENAIYWISEFGFDGLRFDAVHAISPADWLSELAREARTRVPERKIHLVLENDANDASLLREGFDAQWNDDFHHAMHVLLTGETQGYYADYADAPAERLARVLREGFAYQGEPSKHRRGIRGTPTIGLRPTSFVAFLQNHDQTGNRAFGERLTSLTDEAALKAAVALLLLSPQIPLIFMGEEIGSTAPFFYFTDHNPQLADAVRKGRKKEFAFADGRALPDPNAAATFDLSRPAARAGNADAWRKLYRELLHLRAKAIVPRLGGAAPISAEAVSPSAIKASWHLDDAKLTLATNLAGEAVTAELPQAAPLWGDSSTGRHIPAQTTLAWIEAA